MKPKKKRNPTDATLRNIRALKKRVKVLEFRALRRRVDVLELRVKKLEKKNEK